MLAPNHQSSAKFRLTAVEPAKLPPIIVSRLLFRNRISALHSATKCILSAAKFEPRRIKSLPHPRRGRVMTAA